MCEIKNKMDHLLKTCFKLKMQFTAVSPNILIGKVINLLFFFNTNS